MPKDTPKKSPTPEKPARRTTRAKASGRKSAASKSTAAKSAAARSRKATTAETAEPTAAELAARATTNGEPPEAQIDVKGLTKSFGPQVIWEDISVRIPKSKITVILGPSGTGKSVFLKHLVGLLKPDRGQIIIDGKDLPTLPDKELYMVRRKFGVLFQDGALFGSMNVYDNVAFPLREHTKKKESEIKQIVAEKLEMVGLVGAEQKLPGEISGGMKKRAGLARALVLDPDILLFDEPDSGLDPVRTAFLCELIRDLNSQLETTMLVVTHDIAAARRISDYIGMIAMRHLVQFGTAAEMFASDQPEVRQFLAGDTVGPIGMAEEKDAAITSTAGMTAEETAEAERAAGAADDAGPGAGDEGVFKGWESGQGEKGG